MAYNSVFEERISDLFDRKKVSFRKLKMMGGLAFMVDDKMCVGLMADGIMARVDPEFMEEALSKEGCDYMMFTGRKMKSFLTVNYDSLDLDEDLEYWVDKCLEYNPKAPKSKKKKKR